MSENNPINEKQEARGFRGLVHLASDLDKPAPAKALERPQPSQRTTRLGAANQPHPARPQAQESLTQRVIDWINSEPIAATVLAMMIFGLVVVALNERSTGNAGPRARPTAYSRSTSQAPPPVRQAPRPPPPPMELSADQLAQMGRSLSINSFNDPGPAEVKPGVGTTLHHSRANIEYCLAEDIRLSAAKAVLDLYNSRAVNRFNSYVRDYNSRCSQYRYYESDMHAARRRVEARRSQIEQEGRARMRGAARGGATVREIQSELTRLGYRPGPIDGLMGSQTRTAIRDFQRAHGLPVDGIPSAELLRYLRRL